MVTYDVNDIQKILHIKRTTAYRLMNASDFPSIRLGTKHIITDEELVKFLKDHKGKTYNF